ncbi:MAG: SUMF1/EgtB/PvdO family nonheme iron enzyme [Opitutales bacterium]
MKKSFITGIIMLCASAAAFAQNYDVKRVTQAIEDMSKDSRYPAKYKQELKKFNANGKLSTADQAKFDAFAREALLQNPLLQENKDWLFIRRKTSIRTKGLPSNWAANASSVFRNPKYSSQIDDEIYSMDITKPESAKSFYRSPDTVGVTDIDVDYDGSKIMYSALNKNDRWQVYELDLKTKKRRILSIEKYDEIDYYDSVYLPDGKVIFMSTANYAGVPCVNGLDPVSNIYKMDPKSDKAETRDDTIRQLSFDQENSWSPTVMNDGRVMFTRWEYTDNSHYFSRILMRMNPDGSGQMSHYGSTSYWPNSLFYVRPIPGDANKFVGVVSGHHGVARSGELHLFDVSKGVIEDEGRVHQYLGYGEPYVAKMLDNLVGKLQVHFLHPYPLSENYIVVAMQDKKKDKFFSLYLVDKFDNKTLLVSYEKEGYDLFEPIPMGKREKPPLIADKVDEDLDFGYVFLNNIYEGPGLAGVEKGSVKKLRIFEYNYNYSNTIKRGGLVSHETMGMESGWEIKRVHGTVDVEEDGSAMFKLPANRPYSLQPLDKDGKAMALFRSWLTIRPGETLSCVGCHEPSNTAPVGSVAMAGRKPPQNVKEFLGKPRGFSFDREVQPILDAYCVECHNGSKKEMPNFKQVSIPWGQKNYSNSYLELHPYVRRPGPESNQNILSPLEFHASTSELIQILEKGHKGVNMDEDSKKILYTWIDLNIPYHGTLGEAYTKASKGQKGDISAKGNGVPDDQETKRQYFMKKYANRTDYNYEQDDIKYSQAGRIKFNKRGKELTHEKAKTVTAPKFPFKAKEGKSVTVNVEGHKLDFVEIPAGKYVQGSNNSFYDEGPTRLTEIKKPFFMTKFEITNALYAEFNSKHNSGFLDRHWKDHINPGYPANGANMPVIRVSYKEAMAFCEWLSKKLNKKVTLPTEEQWEWAARAGSDKEFWYGDLNTDFSQFENFADKQASKFAVKGVDPQPMDNPNPFYAYVPADSRFDDGQLVPCYKDFENKKNAVEYKHLDCGHIAYATKAGEKVTECPTCGWKLDRPWTSKANGGQTDFYKPNGFGLYDIGGNVAELTRSPYTQTIGGKVVEDKVVIRGGSWADRPSYGKVTLRRPYSPWQRVYNVGFRVIIE